jgi:hypothetical protein
VAATADHPSFNPNVYESDPVELAYRDRLGDGLEKLLLDGADTIEALVSGLNDLGVTSRTGERWFEAKLEAELHRLSI